jgi:hypothetical protein
MSIWHCSSLLSRLHRSLSNNADNVCNDFVVLVGKSGRMLGQSPSPVSGLLSPQLFPIRNTQLQFYLIRYYLISDNVTLNIWRPNISIIFDLSRESNNMTGCGLKNRIRFLATAEFSLPPRPEWLWCLPSFLSSEYRGYLRRGLSGRCLIWLDFWAYL